MVKIAQSIASVIAAPLECLGWITFILGFFLQTKNPMLSITLLAIARVLP